MMLTTTPTASATSWTMFYGKVKVAIRQVRVQIPRKLNESQQRRGPRASPPLKSKKFVLSKEPGVSLLAS